MKITIFFLICFSAISCCAQNTSSTTNIITQAVGGRWQSSLGETYEFTSPDDGTRGTYLHYQLIPPISKDAQADGGQSRLIGKTEGRFFVSGNLLILMSKDGMTQTNQFVVGKEPVVNTTGKFFESGYTLTITPRAGPIQHYDLMYW